MENLWKATLKPVTWKDARVRSPRQPGVGNYLRWLFTRLRGGAMSSTGQKKPTSPMRPKEKLWIEPTQRYEAHRFLETSDDFRLADGRPLSHALLTDPNALVLKAHDANRARGD